jgi:hypothetical protein
VETVRALKDRLGDRRLAVRRSWRPKKRTQGDHGTRLKLTAAQFSRCELLLWEAGSLRGHFGNPEEGERPLLEAATRQRQWRRDCGH